jgi:raffinose/stachyose/melibiose transport system permease protein
VPSRPAAAPGRASQYSHGRGLADLAGLAPAMALFGVFIAVPMLGAVALSLFRWNGLGTPHWAGGANWVQFAHDPLARQALIVTAKVVVLSWLVQTPISIALGLFTAGRQRYRSVYAALYVLPLLLSTAGIALMWEALLDPNFGGLTALGVGFLRQNWLGNPSLTLYVVIALIAWQFIPFHCLLYQMGRRQIPHVLYEAARLDGASPAQLFWRVTLPQLRYTVVTSSTLIIVGSLTYFDIVYIMTSGGPGYTTRVLSLDMYQAAFSQNEFGYASVLAVVLGVVGVGIAFGLVRFSGFGSMASQQEGAA